MRTQKERIRTEQFADFHFFLGKWSQNIFENEERRTVSEAICPRRHPAGGLRKGCQSTFTLRLRSQHSYVETSVVNAAVCVCGWDGAAVVAVLSKTGWAFLSIFSQAEEKEKAKGEWRRKACGIMCDPYIPIRFLRARLFSKSLQLESSHILAPSTILSRVYTHTSIKYGNNPGILKYITFPINYYSIPTTSSLTPWAESFNRKVNKLTNQPTFGIQSLHLLRRINTLFTIMKRDEQQQQHRSSVVLIRCARSSLFPYNGFCILVAAESLSVRLFFLVFVSSSASCPTKWERVERNVSHIRRNPPWLCPPAELPPLPLAADFH